jgi:hypothetical protein
MVKKIALLPLLVVFIAVTAYLKIDEKVSTPTATINDLVDALRAADLPAISQSGLRRLLDQSIQSRGASRHKILMSIFRGVFREGEKDYIEFLKKISSLGSQEFNRMSVDERQLLAASIGKEKFILQAGIEALPPEDRAKIADVNRFSLGEEKELFCIREGLKKVPHDQWEKVKDYEFTILKNQEMRFIREEGKRLIKQSLESNYQDLAISSRKIVDVVKYPGNLFLESEVQMEVELRKESDGTLIGRPVFTLVKFRARWLVESVFPPLF